MGPTDTGTPTTICLLTLKAFNSGLPDNKMEIERQYVDSHGQSTVAFGVCRLLNFLLLTLLKPIYIYKSYTVQKVASPEPIKTFSQF